MAENIHQVVATKRAFQERSIAPLAGSRPVQPYGSGLRRSGQNGGGLSRAGGFVVGPLTAAFALPALAELGKASVQQGIPTVATGVKKAIKWFGGLFGKGEEEMRGAGFFDSVLQGLVSPFTNSIKSPKHMMNFVSNMLPGEGRDRRTTPEYQETQGQYSGTQRMEDYSAYGDFSRFTPQKRSKYLKRYGKLVGGFGMADVPVIIRAIKENPKVLQKVVSVAKKPHKFLNTLVKILKKTQDAGMHLG